jgi:hypothetical protein
MQQRPFKRKKRKKRNVHRKEIVDLAKEERLGVIDSVRTSSTQREKRSKPLPRRIVDSRKKERAPILPKCLSPSPPSLFPSRRRRSQPFVLVRFAPPLLPHLHLPNPPPFSQNPLVQPWPRPRRLITCDEFCLEGASRALLLPLRASR